MLVGALAAIGAQLASHGVSLLLAMGAAAVVSLLFALMVLVLRINQVIAGLALVFFCQGLTGCSARCWTGPTSRSRGWLPSSSGRCPSCHCWASSSCRTRWCS